jgi:hypothetical protein
MSCGDRLCYFWPPLRTFLVGCAITCVPLLCRDAYEHNDMWGINNISHFNCHHARARTYQRVTAPDVRGNVTKRDEGAPPLAAPLARPTELQHANVAIITSLQSILVSYGPCAMDVSTSSRTAEVERPLQLSVVSDGPPRWLYEVLSMVSTVQLYRRCCVSTRPRVCGVRPSVSAITHGGGFWRHHGTKWWCLLGIPGW